MADLVLVSNSPSSVTVQIQNLTYPANEYEFDFRVDGGSWIRKTTTSTGYNSPTCELWTGSSDCPAFVEAITYYGTGTREFSATFYTAKQPPPTLTITGQTSTSISLSWTEVPGATEYTVSNTTTSGLSYQTGTSMTWDGLNPNTSYTFRVKARVEGNCSTYDTDWSATKTGTTDDASTRPNDWAWYTLKTSGTTFNATATEWNDFCARINEFRLYKGLSSYAFTEAVSGNTAYAYQINQAGTAINDMSPPATVPSSVSVGGQCLASTFNGLRDSLNSIQ